MYDHANVCAECEGTAKYLDDGDPTDEECPNCYWGTIELDADDCEDEQCDLCQDPDLENNPAKMYGR